MLCLCSKTYCCYDVTSNILKFSGKGVNKRVLEQSGDGPLEKYRRVLNEKVNVTSKNRGFRTNNHSVATYEKVKEDVSFFQPKRIVKADGIHTQPLNLQDIQSFFHIIMLCNCSHLYTQINFLKHYYDLFPSAANQIRVLRNPSRQPIRIEYISPESSRLGWKAPLGSRLLLARYSLS